MNIQEKINYYSSHMSLNFFIKNTVNLEQLDKSVKKLIEKELKGERVADFSSQDLRTYVIALEKAHKALNKRISFYEFEKYLTERYKKLDTKAFNLEVHKLCEIIRATATCQALLSSSNFYATTLSLCEMQYKQEKEQSDEIFNHEILSGLLEIF